MVMAKIDLNNQGMVVAFFLEFLLYVQIWSIKVFFSIMKQIVLAAKHKSHPH